MLPVDRDDEADVAVIDVTFVVVLRLHHLVANAETVAELPDAVFAVGLAKSLPSLRGSSIAALSGGKVGRLDACAWMAQRRGTAAYSAVRCDQFVCGRLDALAEGGLIAPRQELLTAGELSSTLRQVASSSSVKARK